MSQCLKINNEDLEGLFPILNPKPTQEPIEEEVSPDGASAICSSLFVFLTLPLLLHQLFC